MKQVVGDIRLDDDLSTATLYVRNGPACATTFVDTIAADGAIRQKAFRSNRTYR